MGYLYKVVEDMEKQKQIASRLAKVGATKEEHRAILEFARSNGNGDLEAFVRQCECIDKRIREGETFEEIKEKTIKSVEHRCKVRTSEAGSGKCS